MARQVHRVTFMQFPFSLFSCFLTVTLEKENEYLYAHFALEPKKSQNANTTNDGTYYFYMFRFPILIKLHPLFNIKASQIKCTIGKCR